MAPIPSSQHDGHPKPQVHAMVIPFPAQGHIGPMMHLSLKLARQEGFSITFVNTQYNHPLLSHLLPTFRDEGLDIRLVEVYDKRDSGNTTGIGSIIEICDTFFSLQPQFEELVQSLITPSISSGSSSSSDTHSRPPLSLIISDLYLYFTLDLAAKFSLPHLAFWTTSAGMLASVLAINRGHRPNPDDPLELVRWIPGVPPLKRTEINNFLLCFDPADLMYNFFLESYQRSKETTWVVCNTFEELEHESLEALREENERVFSVGPLLPPAYFNNHDDDDGEGAPNHGDEEALESYQTAALWPEDHACLKWLNGKALKSVLYVSFGSIAVLSREQFEELALGLEASGVALLWVIRPDLMYGEKALFPAGYLERMKERACFVEWAPQLQVLRHGAVGGFLTHCGWNSTLESISAGVPMLGWPYFSDQMLINRCCVDAWGVGLTFEESDPLLGQLVRREEVEAKVRELMGPNSKSRAAIRQKAWDWREAARKAVLLQGGSSERSWRELMELIQSKVAAGAYEKQLFR